MDNFYFYKSPVLKNTAIVKALYNILGEKSVNLLKELLIKHDEGVVIGATELLSDRCDSSLKDLFLTNLKHDSILVRRESAKALLFFPDDRAIRSALKIIESCIDHQDRNVRHGSLEAIGSFNCHLDIIPLLIKGLKSRYQDVREVAVFFIRYIRDTKLVEPLTQIIISDNNVQNRAIAAQGLGWISTEDSVKALIKGLNDNEANVKLQCLYSLAKLFENTSLRVDILDRLLSLLNVNLQQIMSASCKVLGKLEDGRAIPKLLEIARKGYIEVSGEACKALLRIGDRTVVEKLIDVVEHSPEPYAARLFVLSKFGGQMARDYLLRIARGRDEWMMNRVAISYLGYLGDETIIDDLLSFLQSENSLIVEAALKSLAELRHKDIERLLSKYYCLGRSDRSGNTPSYLSIIGIAGRSPDLCKTLLMESLDDDHPDARVLAVKGLHNLKSCDKDTLDKIISITQNERGKVLEQICIFLLRFGNERAIEPLFQAYFAKGRDYSGPKQHNYVLRVVKVMRKYSRDNLPRIMLQRFESIDASERRRAQAAWKALMHEELTILK